MKIFGYVRETTDKANKAGEHKVTGLCRTGLEEYLKVIYPNVDDWVYNKPIPKELQIIDDYKSYRPDYRSEQIKTVIEFDGLPHYQSPYSNIHDKEKDDWYKDNNYKVIRIPYFIGLTNSAVKQLFNRSVEIPLFPDNIPSLSSAEQNTPAFLCIAGIKRMANEFKKFPEQYKINIAALRAENNEEYTNVSVLEKFYNNN